MPSSSAAPFPSVSGRTFVITGANGGIGQVAARVLAERGARVVLAVRNTDKGHAVADAIAGETDVRRLDLADLSSVRSFAAELEGPIDVLINNAGISIPPLARTADGFESQFGTNHLGHFALTNLLLPRVRDRVVTVGSLAHLIGTVDITDLNWHRRPYRPYPAYAQSKLANLLSAYELHRRLTAAGSRVISVAAHPGIATTGLMEGEGAGLRRRIEKALIGAVAHTAESGAQSILTAAVADIPGDSYIGPRRLWGARGAPGPARRASRAVHAVRARQLWEESERLTGTVFPFALTAATAAPDLP